MQTKFIFFILLLIVGKSGHSQTIENVDFVVSNNKIIVTYELVNCLKNEVYDVRLKFVSEKTNYVPVNIKGDLLRLNQGRNKKIEWDVLADGVQITESIQAIVEISARHSTKVIGGPSNALLSVLVPGLGDYFVDTQKDSKIPFYYITVTTYGLLYLGFNQKVESDQSYEDYHKATTQVEMDLAYDAANEAHKSFILYTSLAATVWLGDIAWVTYKGFKNKKEQRSGYAYKKYEKQYFASYTPNGFQLNFRMTF